MYFVSIFVCTNNLYFIGKLLFISKDTLYTPYIVIMIIENLYLKKIIYLFYKTCHVFGVGIVNVASSDLRVIPNERD